MLSPGNYKASRVLLELNRIGEGTARDISENIDLTSRGVARVIDNSLRGIYVDIVDSVRLPRKTRRKGYSALASRAVNVYRLTSIGRDFVERHEHKWIEN